MRYHRRCTFRCRSSAPFLGPRVAESRNGFTLVELLVALVISGVVVGSLFQLLAGQGRFVEMQSGREEVQQNTRAALELIGSELRTLPSGDALVRASADSITIRAPRIWGVICAVVDQTSIDIAVPAVDGVSYSVNSGTGVVANIGTTAAAVWTDPVSVATIGPGQATCNAADLPANVVRHSLTLRAAPQNGGAGVVVGNNIYLYDQVTYRTGSSASVPGLWIQRRLGDAAGSSNQPMAGPVQSGGDGLIFSYFSDASPNPLPVPIADNATRAEVNRVMVVVEAISRNQTGGTPEVKADTVVISLRNRV